MNVLERLERVNISKIHQGLRDRLPQAPEHVLLDTLEEYATDAGLGNPVVPVWLAYVDEQRALLQAKIERQSAIIASLP